MKLFGVTIEFFKTTEPVNTKKISPIVPISFDTETIRRPVSKSAAGFVRKNQIKRPAMKRDSITAINQRWSFMMQEPIETRTKRITFNDNVTMHSILRIQDLIHEFDEQQDTDSVTSLGPGHRTPERNESPVLQPPLKQNLTYHHYSPQGQDFTNLIPELTTRDSETTLDSEPRKSSIFDRFKSFFKRGKVVPL